jgi:hypothetical protein
MGLAARICEARKRLFRQTNLLGVLDCLKRFRKSKASFLPGVFSALMPAEKAPFLAGGFLTRRRV